MRLLSVELVFDPQPLLLQIRAIDKNLDSIFARRAPKLCAPKLRTLHTHTRTYTTTYTNTHEHLHTHTNTYTSRWIGVDQREEKMHMDNTHTDTYTRTQASTCVFH